METEATEQIVKVFYCYAREDKNLRDQLDAHLTPLRRAGRIRTWSNRQIEPGTNWQEASTLRKQGAYMLTALELALAGPLPLPLSSLPEQLLRSLGTRLFYL